MVEKKPSALERYQQAGKAYAGRHAELLKEGYEAYAHRVQLLEGCWSYSYRKDGKTFTLRRSPDTLSWSLLQEGYPAGKLSLTFSDHGDLGGEALKGR